MGCRRIRLAFGVAAPCVGMMLVACSLSLDGYSGGASPDASLTADATDARASVTDGSGGDADSSDGSIQTFCENRPPSVVFCDDFDRSILLGKWKSSVVRAGGTLELTTGTDGRAGNEVHAAIAETLSGSANGLEADLGANPNTVGTAIDYRYRLRVDAAPTQGAAQAMNVYVSHADKSFTALFLLLASDGAYLAQQFFPPDGGATSFTADPFNQPLGYGTWHDVVLHVALTAAPRLTLTVDGVNVLDVPAQSSLVPGTVQIKAGIHYAAVPVGAVSIHFDNVLLDVR